MNLNAFKNLNIKKIYLLGYEMGTLNYWPISKIIFKNSSDKRKAGLFPSHTCIIIMCFPHLIKFD